MVNVGKFIRVLWILCCFYWRYKLFRYCFTLGDFFQPGKHQHHCSMLRPERNLSCGHSSTKLRGTSLKQWISPFPNLTKVGSLQRNFFSNFATSPLMLIPILGRTKKKAHINEQLIFIRCSCILLGVHVGMHNISPMDPMGRNFYNDSLKKAHPGCSPLGFTSPDSTFNGVDP